jgi:cytochrome P450
MTEAVIAIATLLARFSVTSESTDIPLVTNITLRPAGPVRCRLELRRPAPVSQ